MASAVSESQAVPEPSQPIKPIKPFRARRRPVVKNHQQLISLGKHLGFTDVIVADRSDDLIPLLFATIHNPSINYARMAALDPKGRTAEALAYIFHDWHVGGRDMDHKHGLKVAAAAAKAKGQRVRKRRGKAFRPGKLPKAYEKFRPHADDSVDQLEMKKLSQDVVTKEKFAVAVKDFKRLHYITRKHGKEVHVVRKATLKEAREREVSEEQREAEARLHPSPSPVTEDPGEEGQSDTSGYRDAVGYSDDSDGGDIGDDRGPGHSTHDGDDGKGGDRNDEGDAGDNHDDHNSHVDPDSHGHRGGFDAHDIFEYYDSSEDHDGDDESPAKKVKINKDGLAKPVTKLKAAGQAIENIDEAGASGLSDGTLIESVEEK